MSRFFSTRIRWLLARVLRSGVVTRAGRGSKELTGKCVGRRSLQNRIRSRPGQLTCGYVGDCNFEGEIYHRNHNRFIDFFLLTLLSIGATVNILARCSYHLDVEHKYIIMSTNILVSLLCFLLINNSIQSEEQTLSTINK